MIEGVDCNRLAQDRGQWQTDVNTVMNPHVHKKCKISLLFLRRSVPMNCVTHSFACVAVDTDKGQS